MRASATVKILGITIFQEDGDTAALKLGCCLQHGGLVFGRDGSEQTILCLSLTSIHLGWPDDVCVHCRHSHTHTHISWPKSNCVSKVLMDVGTASSTMRDATDKSKDTVITARCQTNAKF